MRRIMSMSRSSKKPKDDDDIDIRFKSHESSIADEVKYTFSPSEDAKLQIPLGYRHQLQELSENYTRIASHLSDFIERFDKRSSAAYFTKSKVQATLEEECEVAKFILKNLKEEVSNILSEGVKQDKKGDVIAVEVLTKMEKLFKDYEVFLDKSIKSFEDKQKPKESKSKKAAAEKFPYSLDATRELRQILQNGQEQSAKLLPKSEADSKMSGPGRGV